MIVEGIEYAFVRENDVVRDGVFVEVSKRSPEMIMQVAEVFYSDATSTFSLSCFE